MTQPRPTLTTFKNERLSHMNESDFTTNTADAGSDSGATPRGKAARNIQERLAYRGFDLAEDGRIAQCPSKRHPKDADGNIGGEWLELHETDTGVSLECPSRCDVNDIVEALDLNLSHVEDATWEPKPKVEATGPVKLDDATISEVFCERYLRGKYLYTSGLGWLQFDGRRWMAVDNERIVEVIRKAVRKFNKEELRSGADADRMKKVAALLSYGKIWRIALLARGIECADADEFDQHPDLLNAGNGVIDLRTGELLDHNPDLRLTKVTPVNYVPGASHPHWDKAQEALTEDVVEYLQVRLGQAATGHPTSDDVLPILRGGGANGKTTLLDSVRFPLGEHCVAVSKRVLVGNPNNHPTELMDLRGARMGIVEELPEGKNLNISTLKDTLGTGKMTARLMRKDSVEWTPTHSLIVTTNYLPKVGETDHGTWRRLALIEFPYTFRREGEEVRGPMDRLGDPSIRDGLKRGDDGQHEAVLAWIVAGARWWYANDMTLPEPPPSVIRDTLEWRGQDDHILKYITERLVFDVRNHAASTDLYEDHLRWLKENGHKECSSVTFWNRFKGHDTVMRAQIERQQVSASHPTTVDRPGEDTENRWGGQPVLPSLPKRYQAWIGVRFRTESEDLAVPGAA